MCAVVLLAKPFAARCLMPPLVGTLALRFLRLTQELQHFKVGQQRRPRLDHAHEDRQPPAPGREKSHAYLRCTYRVQMSFAK